MSSDRARPYLPGKAPAMPEGRVFAAWSSGYARATFDYLAPYYYCAPPDDLKLPTCRPRLAERMMTLGWILVEVTERDVVLFSFRAYGKWLRTRRRKER